MPHIKKISVCFFIPCILSPPVAAETSIETSARLLNFNYEEFDQSGQSLDQETGVIPGLSITALTTAASTAHGNFSNAISFELYDGQVDYDGQTNTGVPHTTVTDESLYRLFYKLNWSPANYSSSIYGKVAWQQWDRNILPANGVSGLFEQYQWWAFEAGFLATLFEDNSNRWQAEFGISKISNGSIQIDLAAQGFGNPELSLGDGNGISAAVKYQHQLSARDSVGLALSHQYWTFGRSNSKTLSNGSSNITITEPRSVSNHTSISINYIYSF